jgi:hypothetical protein
MKANSLYFSSQARYVRLPDSPLSLGESLRIYFTILVGVTVSLLVFHATWFPLH